MSSDWRGLICMKYKLLSVLCLFFLIPSCSSKSKLPNDDKYLIYGHKENDVLMIQTDDFYVYKGSIVKENNRYYFVDSEFTFHCSVYEDTRVYENDNFDSCSSNYSGVKENKGCYIWISYNIKYSDNHEHEDRPMSFNYVEGCLYETGFYDHVLDIYYNCSSKKIKEHNLKVTYQHFPNNNADD